VASGHHLGLFAAIVIAAALPGASSVAGHFLRDLLTKVGE